MDDLEKRADAVLHKLDAQYDDSTQREAAAMIRALLAERAQVEKAVREILHECALQLKYLDDRSPSGTTPAVLARITSALEE